MRPFLPTIFAASFLLLPVARAAAAPKAPAQLIGRLRVLYSQPTSFSPAGMRYPLRQDLQADLAEARAALSSAPDRLEALRSLAVLLEQADDPAAEAEWRRVLDAAETALKKKPQDLRLLEYVVEAMVGADVALRVVPAGQRLAAGQPQSWRAHLLLGDAHLRRADHHWRVLLQIARGTKALPPQHVLELNADLAAAEKAYSRSVELAPGEPAPRAGKIATWLARPVMAGLLPDGVVKGAAAPDFTRVRRELIDLTGKSNGTIAPIWHTAHFLATQGTGADGLREQEQKVMAEALQRARTRGESQLFLAEAEGMLALAERDPAAARTAFEKAVTLMPERNWGAEWLALAEASSSEPRERILERIDGRLKVRPHARDWVLRGVLVAPDNRSAAMDSFRKAIELDVDNASARYNLAVLLLQRDPDSIEARHHLERSLEVRAGDRDAQFAVFLLRALDGELTAGRQALAELAKQGDLDPDLKKRLEATLQDLGAGAKPAGK